MHVQESEPHPELYEHGIERRGPDDDRPELESERAMDAAVDPPPSGPVAARRRRIRRFRVEAHDVVTQHLEHLRHTDEDGDAAVVKLADDVLRRVAAGE